MLQHSDHTIRSRQSCFRALISGHDTEPWEIVYFKLYKSQILVIERAIETAALTDKSRGYCLEMIRADFLAGATLENGNPGCSRSLGCSSFCPANNSRHLLNR